MSFQENLATLPSIDHLSSLNITDNAGNVIHHIPAAPGKLGSLKLYNALAEKFSNTLNAEAAEYGLSLFAEHVADAETNPGKHPNIDLLFKVKQENLNLTLQPVNA